MTFTVKKKPVFISLPYKDDDIPNTVAQRLRNTVRKTFHAAELIIINETQKMLIPSVKDKTPVLDTSKFVEASTLVELTGACPFE